MLGPLANLNVRIGSDITEFQKTAQKMERALEPVRRRLTQLGTTLSVAVTAPIVALGAKSVQAWDKQAKAVAKVENTIRSTGGAAGKTLEQLQKIASDLQSKTLFGDEEILEGATAQLLTFTNIAGSQFERTQAVALDLATMLGTDLKSASIQLGKALNDPVANLSALSRSGIQFSTSQKEVIKSLTESGRLAEAQNVILAELERQYGGTAEAAAMAGTGPLTQLKNSIGDITEEIGRIILEAISPLVKHLQAATAWFASLSDGTKKTIVVVAGIAAAVGPLLLSLGGILKILPLVKAGFGLLTGAMGPVGIAAIAIGAAAVLIYKNWDRLKELFGGTISRIMERLKPLFETIRRVAADVFESVMQLARGFAAALVGIWDGLTSAARAIWDQWGAEITAITNFLFTHLVDVVRTSLKLVGDLFGAVVDLITGDWSGLWDRLKSITMTITRFIARLVLRMVDIVLAGIDRMFSWIPGVESAVARARGFIQGLIEDMKDPAIAAPQLEPEAAATGGPIKPSMALPLLSPDVMAETVGQAEEVKNALTSIPEAVQASGLVQLSEDLSSMTLELPPVDTVAMTESLAAASASVDYEMSRMEMFFARAGQRFQEAIPQIASTIASGFQDAATGMLEGIGRMLAGADTAGGVVRSVLTSLADLAVRVGKIAVGVGFGVEGIKRALQTLNPIAAIAAGAALIAIGTAAKSALAGAASGGGGSFSPGGFGQTSIVENANIAAPVSTRPSRAEEVRVVLEPKVLPSGDISYSVDKGDERLSRRGTDLK